MSSLIKVAIIAIIAMLTPYCIINTVIHLERGCNLTKINGRVRHNQRRKKTTLTFSSDDDLRTTYRCKLDNRDFQQCKF